MGREIDAVHVHEEDAVADGKEVRVYAETFICDEEFGAEHGVVDEVDGS